MEPSKAILLDILGRWENALPPTTSSSTGKEEVVSRIALDSIRGSNEATLRKDLNAIRRGRKENDPLIAKINRFEKILDKAHELNRNQIADMLDLDNLHVPKSKIDAAKSRIVDCYLSDSKSLDLSELKIASLPPRAALFLTRVNITLYIPTETEPSLEPDSSSTDLGSLPASGDSTPLISSPPLHSLSYTEARDLYAKLLVRALDKLGEIHTNISRSSLEEIREKKEEYLSAMRKILEECSQEGDKLEETYDTLSERLKNDPLLTSKIIYIYLAIDVLKNLVSHK